MVRYSILIPTYNAADTIERCLDSILIQKGNYEIIVMDDGSKDNISDKIKPYLSKITYIANKKNKGVAFTRNNLIKKAKGKYLLFVDADDYLKPGLLEKMDLILDEYNELDVISFCMETVGIDQKMIYPVLKPALPLTNGEELFTTFVENRITFDTPVGYLYRKKYLLENNFFYEEGYHHEDFGLTPLILVYASRIISIEDSFYCYVQTNNSITRGDDPLKMKRNAYDMLHHFDKLKDKISQDNVLDDKTKRYFNSFLANSLLLKLESLTSEYKSDFRKELKKRKILSMLLTNTWKRKLKKLMLSIKL